MGKLGAKQPNRRSVPLFDRYYAFVDQRGPDECWPWKGYTTRLGYAAIVGGRRSLGARLEGAHRVGWVFANGREIPDGYEIDHTCRNPCCQNPRHLDLVTHAINVRRIQERQTHCRSGGHPFNEENTRWSTSPNGQPYRQCRVCDRERKKLAELAESGGQQ